MNPLLLQLAQIGITAAIEALMANHKANAVISGMVAEGRTKLTAEEEAALNAESDAIHEQHRLAIQQAAAAGR